MGAKAPEQKMIAVDTKNILFVCGGAFDGIEKKIAQRLNTRVVGYAANENTAPGGSQQSAEIHYTNRLEIVWPDSGNHGRRLS